MVYQSSYIHELTVNHRVIDAYFRLRRCAKRGGTDGAIPQPVNIRCTRIPPSLQLRAAGCRRGPSGPLSDLRIPDPPKLATLTFRNSLAKLPLCIVSVDQIDVRGHVFPDGYSQSSSVGIALRIGVVPGPSHGLGFTDFECESGHGASGGGGVLVGSEVGHPAVVRHPGGGRRFCRGDAAVAADDRFSQTEYGLRSPEIENSRERRSGDNTRRVWAVKL